jgi:serine/threonine protein kinase/WD40 repeat protein
MNPDVPNRKTIFGKALEILSPTERSAYLDRACADNAALRAEVEELLAAAAQAGSFLEKPAADPNVFAPTVNFPPLQEGPGTTIGPYKLLQQIGEGGFGVVYMAEQAEPVRRKVALKVIKPGMDTRQVIARFEAERQALAMMDHQNIARVLDAGATDSGRPYFVMELVKGVPITDYCDGNKLTPRERLELFIPVCQAIQHAHQKGIIHRDIKPSNVLVCLYDGKPVPKVIDFGVAKAIEQRLTEKTMFTQHGQVIGTLEYMSPEQAELSQLDIDTRSDVYSLGVLLYELLTGTTPITKEQLRTAGFTEMLRMIREKEPERPSTRLSHSQSALPTISAQRRTEPAKLGAILRGELDWIVMKSLEKDRTRRYETANGLVRDIERYLHDEPVEACPPSVGYRMRKFMRRHRAPVGIGGIVVFLLAAVLVNHFVGYVRLKEARGRAAEAANRARMAELEALNSLDQAVRERERAGTAEKQAQDERDRAREAERQARAERDRSLVAERQAAEQRDRAVAAEQQALRQRELETQAREEAQAALARSLFEQARAVRLAGLPGRRFQSLELLCDAGKLHASRRPKGVAEQTAPPSGSPRLPEPSELRTEAVAALLLRDARIARQWDGITHSVSPDGRYAASMWLDLAKGGGGLRIVDLQSGEDVTPESMKDNIAAFGVALALGPEAKQLASVPHDFRSLNLMDVATGKKVRTLELASPAKRAKPDAASGAASAKDARAASGGAPASKSLMETVGEYGMVRYVAISPDGRFLVASRLVFPDSEILVWDLSNKSDRQGTLVGTVTLSTHLPAFSSDSRLLAFATRGPQVVVWNLPEARLQQTLEMPYNDVGPVGFVPDGRLACLCNSRRATDSKAMLVFRNLADDGKSLQIPMPATHPVMEIAFTPDGARCALATTAGTVEIYNLSPPVETGTAEIAAPPAPVVLDHGAVPQLLAWSAAGDRLYVGGIGSLKQWEFADPTVVSQFALRDAPVEEDAASGGTSYANQAPISLFAFDRSGRYVAAERRMQPRLALYDRNTGRLVRKLDAGAAGGHAMSFSPDGRRLARLDPLRLRVWDVETGNETLALPAKAIEQGAIASLAFAGDGRILVGGSKELQPVVIDAATRDVVMQFTDARGGVAMISPDGRRAVAVSFLMRRKKEGLPVFDVDRNAEHVRLERMTGSSLVPSITFSPAARQVLVLHVDYPLPGATGFSLAGHGMDVVGAASDGWTGDLFDGETGRLEMTLRGPSTPAEHAFSPDGRYLAISLKSGLVMVYDIENRRELFDWQPWTDPTAGGSRRLAFTPDNTALVVADAERPVLRLLDLPRLNRQLEEYSLGW